MPDGYSGSDSRSRTRGPDPVERDDRSVEVEVDEDPDGAGADAGGAVADDQPVVHPEEVDREFDWRGWMLVGAIFVSFLVVPGIIVLYPHVGAASGLSFWDAYLVLPMLPAVVLAALAVWATTRP